MDEERGRQGEGAIVIAEIRERQGHDGSGGGSTRGRFGEKFPRAEGTRTLRCDTPIAVIMSEGRRSAGDIRRGQPPEPRERRLKPRPAERRERRAS